MIVLAQLKFFRTAPSSTLLLASFVICAMLASSGFGLLRSAAAEELVEIRAGKVLAVLQSAPEGGPRAFQFVLKPIGGTESLDFDLSAKVFGLKSPTRLVVDLPNVGAEGDRKFPVTSPEIGSIRLGAHADKTRFVIDMKGAAETTYNVRSDAATESLIVDFSLSGTGASTAASSTSASQSRAASSSSSSSTSSPEPIIPDDVEEVSPEISSSSSSKSTFVYRNNDPVEEIPPVVREGTATSQAPTEGEQPKPAVVRGIYFQAPTDSKVGSVAIDVESLGTYRLDQLSDETYELIISKANLAGSHLVLPQFPPDTFGGFQVLIAREVEGSVAIKIYVNKGTKLTPYRAQEKLWIRAVGDKQ